MLEKIRKFKIQLLIFFGVLGPGIITSAVDNDAGGIATYSIAGAHFGYSLLWTMIPIAVILVVVQEMNARMGIVTGKGLADLIRENFGLRITFFVMAALFFTNLTNTVAEFAGIAAASELFGITKFIAVPLGALFVWLLIVRGTYKNVEKAFLFAVLFYFAYIIAGLMIQPDWLEVGKAVVNPSIQIDSSYLMIIVGLIGATIAPWMQFYLQASIAEKGIKPEELHFSRMDVILGSIVTVIIMLFIIVTTATVLHPHGIRIDSAENAAKALGPLAGNYASSLFALGLLAASVFAAAILPLATAYYVCEGFGFESGVNKKIREAPQFYSLFTAMILVGAGLILIPNIPLISIMYWSQVLNGILLPIVLILMLYLINNKKLMGPYVNGTKMNIMCWIISGGLIIASVSLILSML
ncbi:MAG: Nramp family divalent metal transporter [Candidatus Diapherotrites archaeon]